VKEPVFFDTIITMSKKEKKSPSRNITAMIILGAGLILLGLAVFIAWPKAGANTELPVPEAGSLAVPVEVYYESPNLELSGLDGMEHELTEHLGEVVLINLWATWCPPCKAEMPTLEAYYKAHQADGFVTIAVNDGDPTESVAEFVQEYELTFPVWLDPTYEATDNAFKTRNLPSSFVIDREGYVRLRWVGEIDRAALEKYVTPLILE
jgi:cytochrome c biogenesis protein CcmG, thiol:disulfide interchange protein DsbE